MKRLISVSYVILTLLCVAVFGADQAPPDTHLAFIESGDGWTTTLVAKNPTASAVLWPDYYPRFGSRTVGPNSVLRDSAYFAANAGGVLALAAPSTLEVYTEVCNPNGIRMRIGDVGPPVDEARFLDLLSDNEWVAYLFIFAPHGATVSINGVTQPEIPAGQSIAVALPTGAVAATILRDKTWDLQTHNGPIYTWVIDSHQPRGEMFPILRE